MAPKQADPEGQPTLAREMTAGSGRQVFVGAGLRRAGAVRWAGRGVAVVVLAYLVLLGASLARAPWAPRVSLPGLGPVTPPVLHVSPPSLGSHALTTPVPPAVVEAATAPRRTGGSGGTTTPVTRKPAGTTGGGAVTTGSSPSATAPGRTTTTSTTTGGATSTTRSSPSATAPGRTTTTGGTATGRGRSGSHP
ncbi:MAG: hypothetical protein ACYCS2_01235 [Acidimicrobiales bacterium]